MRQKKIILSITLSWSSNLLHMALVSSIISSWILWKSSQLLEKNGSCQNKSLKVIGTRWPQATQAFPFPELLLLFANAILFIFSVKLWIVFLLLLFSTISDLVVFSVWGFRCKVSVLISVMLCFSWPLLGLSLLQGRRKV